MKRLQGPKKIGFFSQGADEDSYSKEDTTYSKATCFLPEDLIQLGFLDEFVGRFHIITEFKPLSFEHNLDIIFAEDSILQQYMQIFNSKDVTVYIDPIHFTRIA